MSNPYNSFEPMAPIVPEGQKGIASIEHFSISKRDSEFSSIRASLRPEEYVAPGEYVRLKVDRQVMMSDTSMEKQSNMTAVRKATGDVLIAGLGVGLILMPILRKAEVKSVTVLEKHQDVIDLVEAPIRQALGPELSAKLTVLHTDVFTWEPPKGQKWDHIYFDIWPTICTDSLKEMETLHKKFARRKTSKSAYMDSWMRDRLKYELSRQKNRRW
jgi:hypothetical protein